jgi:hypothetical protein
LSKAPPTADAKCFPLQLNYFIMPSSLSIPPTHPPGLCQCTSQKPASCCRSQIPILQSRVVSQRSMDLGTRNEFDGGARTSRGSHWCQGGKVSKLRHGKEPSCLIYELLSVLRIRHEMTRKILVSVCHETPKHFPKAL